MRLITTLVLLLGLTALAACHNLPLSTNNPKEITRAHDALAGYGCPEQANAGAAVIRSTQHVLSATTNLPRTPEIGWTACDMLLTWGYPEKVEVSESETITARHWWYTTYDDAVHLVELTKGAAEEGQSPWHVTYVGW